MPFMPFAILGIWFRGLLALGLLGGGIWLLATWYDGLPHVTPVVQAAPDGTPPPARPLSFGERVAQWHPDLSWETAALGGGLVLVLVASGGGLLVYPLRWRSGPPVPLPARARSVEHLPGPAEIWFDPRLHLTITRQDTLQVAAREAVVVYSRATDGGPANAATAVTSRPRSSSSRRLMLEGSSENLRIGEDARWRMASSSYG